MQGQQAAVGGRRRSRLGRGAGLLGALLAVPGAVAAHVGTPPPTTEVVDVTPGGVAGNGSSSAPSLSDDASIVAFASVASDLVAGDTNGAADVFVRNRATGTTARVSVSTGGTQADGPSHSTAVSTDGRYVAFDSDATNLVATDLNLRRDVFVHDRLTGQTTLASVPAAGVPILTDATLEALSPEGRFVAFSTTTPAGLAATTTALLLHDRDTGSTELVATGVVRSGQLVAAGAAISLGGRHVAYTSATDDATIGDSNGHADVYRRDRQASSTSIAGVAPGGAAATGPSGLVSMSENGRFVTFNSNASNLVPLDANGATDAFVRDLEAGRTSRVTLLPDGTERPGGAVGRAASLAGRHIVLDDPATGALAVHDRLTGGGTVEDSGATPAISASGDKVVSVSGSRIVIHDRQVDERLGFLRVTTDPPVPSQIVVDGVPRATYGLVSLGVAPGTHQVCFRDVEGFTTPPCQDVTVAHGVTTQVAGAFTPRGFLQVLTSPALPAAISVDGVVRDDWGIYTDLPTGNHEVCFGPVADYAAPGCQTVSLSPGLTTTVTGTYTLSLGAPARAPGNGFLRVTTTPALPSQITVDGVPRSTYGLIGLELAPGPHQVCFRDVEGYDTPACRTVDVVAGATATTDGAFLARGFLAVTTSPALPGAVYVDGVFRDEWGLNTDLAAGPHQVCFGPVAFHREPLCQSLVVAAGATTPVVGAYTVL